MPVFLSSYSCALLWTMLRSLSYEHDERFESQKPKIYVFWLDRLHCEKSESLSIIQRRSYLYASTHVRTWKIFLQRARYAIGQQNVRWKLNFKHSTCVKILPTPQQTVILSLHWFSVHWLSNIIFHWNLVFHSACSIDTWPYLFRVSLALAYDLRRRSWQAPDFASSRASDDECACMEEG